MSAQFAPARRVAPVSHGRDTWDIIDDIWMGATTLGAIGLILGLVVCGTAGIAYTDTRQWVALGGGGAIGAVLGWIGRARRP